MMTTYIYLIKLYEAIITGFSQVFKNTVRIKFV